MIMEENSIQQVTFDNKDVCDNLIEQVVRHGEGLLRTARITSNQCFNSGEDELMRTKMRECVGKIVILGRFCPSEMIVSVIFLRRTFDTCSTNGTNMKLFETYTDLIFMVVTSLILSHKASNDVCHGNKAFCRSDWGNLSVSTVNEAESFMLKTLNFDLSVEREEFEEVSGSLVSLEAQ
jgi:hypothetical protein